MKISFLRDSRLTFKKIYIGSGISLLVLLVVIIFGYLAFDEARHRSQWVNHTFGMISEIQEIDTLVNEIGTEQRGYIITQKSSYRKSFLKHLPLLDESIDRIQRQSVDNPFQQDKLKELRPLIRELLEHYSYNVRLVEDGRPSDAVKNVIKGTSQERYKEIIKILTEMRSHEEKLLQFRLREQETANNVSNILILLGSLISFMMILIAFYMVTKEFRQRIQAQKKLNETMQIQRAILDSAAFAIIALDPEGKVILFNPAAEALLGYNQEEILGLTPERFHSAEELIRLHQYLVDNYREPVPYGMESLLFRARKGITVSEQWSYIRKDGSTVPVNLTISPQTGSAGDITGFVGLAFDISKQLNYETELLSAKELALAGTKAKSEFLANMSHEIRTPMNAIMGMAELLSETPLNDEQKKYVEIFQRSGESLLNLINDILDLSKIEAGHFELDKVQFNLVTIVEKASEIMAVKAHQKHLEFAVDIDENLHEYYLGDPNRLRQILINLLGNAIKFTKRGEILLKIYPGESGHDSSEIFIEVQDSGIGMKEDQLQRLFQRFGQGDSSITKEYGGTGLGLNITKKLVDLMDGDIDVASTYGIGTRFTVRLKLTQDKSQNEASEVTDLTGKRILVVDDTRTNRYILKKILEHQGARVDEAESGESALEKIQDTRNKGSSFDIILLDCRMAGMDGFTVAEKLQKLMPDEPVLMMLTSDSRPGDMAKSRQLGLRSYLIKPVLKHELLCEITRALSPSNIDGTQEIVVPEERETISKLKILLVDDNIENRLVIRSFLKNFPWMIEEASNGKEAVTLAEKNKFDLILMDMQMPVLDGYSATREIRNNERENGEELTPVIALTAYALKEEVDKSFEAGCNSHLTKPVSKKVLIQEITNLTSTILVSIDKELEELIPEYIEKRFMEVAELLNAFDKKDFSRIQAIGHRLRGSAGSYGFDLLSEIGKTLEEKAKISDTMAIKQALLNYRLYLKNIRIGYN